MAANDVPQQGSPTTSDAGVGDETQRADTEASQEVMNLLSEHVPLALLADLAIPSGPQSPQILEDEGLPDVAWWEPGEGEDHGSTPADGAAVAP